MKTTATTNDALLTTLFFHNRHLLGVVVATLLVAGIAALINLPRIEDPRITNRNPTILTLLPGASAARVEALVTKKLEDALREIEEIKEIESTSRPGVSFIALELEDSIGKTTNEAVFSKIRDKLADAERELPSEAFRPEFDDKRGAVAYSIIAAVTWDAPGQPQLGIMTRLAQALGDRLRNVPGTETVKVYGDTREEITVTVDPDEMVALGLSSTRISELIAASDSKVPAGALRTARRDVFMEVDGGLDSQARIAEIPLLRSESGAIVTLGDLAQIKKEWREPPQAVALSDGDRAVLVAVRVEDNIRVDSWAKAAREVISQFRGEAGAGIDVEITFDQSAYTRARLESVSGNLLAGAAVVVLVVLVGMGWQAALIVGAALPLSAAFALSGLTFFGQQIHQMTVFGMIIAIGLLIDNAIVVTDEVRKQLARGLSRAQVMTRSVRHLFTPLVASTVTTILGFMPVFLLPGNVGDFVGPIAISVILALVGSLAVSLTVIAALAAHFVNATKASRSTWWRDGVASTRLTKIYRRLLGRLLARPVLTVTVTLLLPVLGFALASTLGNQFFPPADRDQFEVEVWLRPGSSLARTTELAGEMEQLILAEEHVQRVDWLVGASYPTVYYNLVMRRDNEPSYAHAIVLSEDAQAVKTLVPKLQSMLDKRFPDARVVVSPFGQGPPYEAPVAFRIVGPGLTQLKQYGDELRRIMHLHSDVIHTQATIMGGEPKLWFEADEQEARLAGLTLDDIARQFQGNLEGQLGGSVLEDLEELPVRIRYDVRERGTLDRIGSLSFVSSAPGTVGEWIPAGAVGQLSLRPEPASITRRDGERVNKVLGYVTQGTLPIEVTNAILESLETNGLALAPGYRLEVAGDSEEQGRAIAQLMTYLPVLVVLMVGTLVLSFRSVVLAGVIGAVAFLSIGLGMLSLWFSGYLLGFNPILGTAGLVGVAINGSIVVLAAIRANAGARAGKLSAIVEETIGSTRHIFATTLTTIGGFVPLLLFTGGDFWPPLAVVIAGGVGFGVGLALLFTPAIYYLIYGRLSAVTNETTDVAPLLALPQAVYKG